MPTIKQAFLGRPADCETNEDFERRLYIGRRTIEKRAKETQSLDDKTFYVCSMSARTIVYKGMLVSTQMRGFFKDLDDASCETAIALVHSRYSTNTTPSWERAHPNRYMVHNGEINTLRCNVNWTLAREPHLYSPVMGPSLEKVLPVFNGEGSDSAMLDNMLEFITMNGRSLPRAISMLLPEPWDKNPTLSKKRSAWGEYQPMLTEAWEGPAAIAFTNGIIMGAVLDRNGLRPARYYVTSDDRLILSSEAGTLDVDPAKILIAGSLGPGQMLIVDPREGRVIFDDEIKDDLANQAPYLDWINAETHTLDSLICQKRQNRSRLTLDEGLGLEHSTGYTWLLLRRYRGSDHPYGGKGKGAVGVDGRGYPSRMFIGTSAPLFPLLQPTLRAGHESPDRRAARIAPHLHAALSRQPRQPARRRSHELPPGATRYAAAYPRCLRSARLHG